MSIQHCQRMHTYGEFLEMVYYLSLEMEQEWSNKTKLEYYIAALTAEIHNFKEDLIRLHPMVQNYTPKLLTFSDFLWDFSPNKKKKGSQKNSKYRSVDSEGNVRISADAPRDQLTAEEKAALDAHVQKTKNAWAGMLGVPLDQVKNG